MTIDAQALAASFAGAEALESDLHDVLATHGIDGDSSASALAQMLGRLVTVPNTVFDEPPAYRRDDLTGPAIPWERPARAAHDFFDVLRARGSRRDLGTAPVPREVLLSVLHWTVGRRGATIAYDFRDAPVRYVPSAGGLASTDAYVVVNRVDGVAPGAYYVDYERGLVRVAEGHMIHRLADANPEQEWVAASAAVVVFAVNPKRVAHKYGAMGFKLMLLDAGVAVGHAELVAAAHELRATILGGLPVDDLAALLRLDLREQVPVVSLALGSRPGHA